MSRTITTSKKKRVRWNPGPCPLPRRPNSYCSSDRRWRSHDKVVRVLFRPRCDVMDARPFGWVWQISWEVLSTNDFAVSFARLITEHTLNSRKCRPPEEHTVRFEYLDQVGAHFPVLFVQCCLSIRYHLPQLKFIYPSSRKAVRMIR